LIDYNPNYFIICLLKI